jgi:O-antigen/teichoic acid export membrane protein
MATDEPVIETVPARRQGRRDLLVSYAYLLVSNIGGQIIGFAALAVVARRIGPHDLGAYNFANNLSSFFALPLMAGVVMVGMRDLAKSVEHRSTVVREVQSFCLLNGIIAYGALILLTPVLTSDPLARRLMPIVGLPLLFNGIGLDWAMQGLQRARPLAFMRFGGQVVYAAALAFLLGRGESGTVRYAWANAIGFGVTAAVTLVYVWRIVPRAVERVPLRKIISHLIHRARASIAPGASLVMIQIYYASDVVILGYMSGDHAVGIYSTATRLPLAATVFASLWVTVFYPHAAQLAKDDRATLTDQVGQFATLAIIAGLPLLPVGFIIGRQLLGGMFGGQFAAGGTAFAILLVSSAAALLNSTIGQTLLASADDRAFLISVTIGAVANVALNFALIPVLGIDGSALATLAAESLIIGLATARFRATVGRFRLEWQRLLRATLVVAAAAGILDSLHRAMPWWLSGTIYVVACCAGFVGTRTIDPRELRRKR